MAPTSSRSAGTFPGSAASTWRETLARPPRWLPWLVALAVIAALAVVVVDIAGALRYRPAPADVALPEAAADYGERIAAAGWFGEATPADSGAAQPLADSTLGLTLRAVFVGSSAASAIVETAAGRAEVIQRGAEVAPGVTLQEVHTDRIVLLRNGRPEQLHFPAGSERPAVASADTPAETPAAASAAMTEEEKRANILRRLEELRARGAG